MRRHARDSALALAGLFLLGVASPAGAINNFNDQGVPYREVAGDRDLSWCFFTNPPGTSGGWAAYRSDVDTTTARWSALADGFDSDFIKLTSCTGAELRVLWQVLPPGTGGATGMPTVNGYNQCGTGTVCELKLTSVEPFQTGAAAPDPGEWHHRSVIMHELGHSLGLGHSNVSGDGLSPKVGLNGAGQIPLEGDTGGLTVINDRITKDDCASALFQRFVVATCNRYMDRIDTSGAAGGNDPEMFNIWYGTTMYHYMSCDSASSGGLGGNCAWRLNANGGGQGSFGIWYDIESPEPYPGGPAANPLRGATQWKVDISVGAPNYNTASVSFRVCLYLRVDADGANQRYAPGAKCSSVYQWSGFKAYETVTSGYYTLPEDVTQGERLRGYVQVWGLGSLYISTFEMNRSQVDG